MRNSHFLEMLVGLFVVLGVAAIFLLTLRVSDLSGSQGLMTGYRVTARFENIGGLKVGSPVTLAGVRIGRVVGIQVDQQQFEAVVSLQISDQYNTIPNDSDAQILTAGLLGEQYIGLNAGGATETLRDGDEIKLTQSAMVLEKLIGTVLDRMTSGSNDKAAPAAGTPETPPVSQTGAPPVAPAF